MIEIVSLFIKLLFAAFSFPAGAVIYGCCKDLSGIFSSCALLVCGILSVLSAIGVI